MTDGAISQVPGSLIMPILQSPNLGDSVFMLGAQGQAQVVNRFVNELRYTGAEQTLPQQPLSRGASIMNLAGTLYGIADFALNFGMMTPTRGALSGITVGAGIGTMIAPGFGTAVGGIIGAFAGAIAGFAKKSGKSADQKLRDQLRAALQQAGVIDDRFTIGLANGFRYDIGVDGGPKKAFGGRRPFEFDPADPLSAKLARIFLPLALSVCGGNRKLSTELAGYLVNAAGSNAKGEERIARDNVAAIYRNFGATDAEIAKVLKILGDTDLINAPRL